MRVVLWSWNALNGQDLTGLVFYVFAVFLYAAQPFGVMIE